MNALRNFARHSKRTAVVLAALGASVAAYAAGCAGDAEDPHAEAAQELAVHSDLASQTQNGPFAHVLSKVQASILRSHGTFSAVAGQRTVQIDPATCTKVVTQIYNVAFVAAQASSTGAAAVSCTATCHGNSCTAQGCTPDGNGGCTGDVSCVGQGCSDASCSTSTSTDNGLYGGIVEVQSAGG